MRRALGTAVFWGMLGVTFFGLLLTPVFYVAIRRMTEGKALRKKDVRSALEAPKDSELETAAH
jgi:hypothetical protein